ncbi:hypothetical protein ABPG74_022565 [Tetrahymena malaccensis]
MEQQNQNPIVFVYNQNYAVHHVTYHFFVTQFLTLIMAIIITGLMQYSNHLAIYLIYCCPMYFFLAFIQWFIFWKSKDDFSFWLNVYNFFMFIICSSIFLGVFFGVFHPTASLEFKQAQNCQMVGKLSKWIEFTEKYSILYINFEYEGKNYLGQACASNLYQAKIANLYLPYRFYYKNDKIQCGPTDGNSTEPQYHNRILFQNQFVQTRLEKNQRILKSRRSGRSSRSSILRGGTSSSSSSSCYRNYLWSKVKIASWLCMDNEIDEEDFMEPQSCYVNFFNGDKAMQNGILRAPMKDQYNFPLISYKSHAYYPEIDLICLIIFTYYNSLLSFSSIFQYPANYILKKCNISTKNHSKVIPLQILPNEKQSIQQEQENKDKLNSDPSLSQIEQKKNDLSMSIRSF